DAVSDVIPGARKPTQARPNAEAADLPRLSDELMGKIRDVYDQDIKPHVHQRW
ncbi:aldo/keto reductase, partial [Mesorhizobium sp. M7A.F.Ca.US.014.04.1.1]